MKYRWPLTFIAAVFSICCTAAGLKYLDYRQQLIEHQGRARQLSPDTRWLLQPVPNLAKGPEVPKLWPIHRPPVPDAIWTE